MDTKILSSFDKHDPTVKELIFYARWCRRIFFLLLWTFTLNSILTYGLIFHPSKPSISTCAPYCPQIQAQQGSDPPLGVISSLPQLVDHEVVVREQPNTTALSVRSPAELDTRFDYGNVHTGVALAMAGYWVGSQSLQWYNMVGACQDFSSSSSNALNCIWGAVSTAITAAGAAYSAYMGYGRIQTWMNNNGMAIGWKRDEVDQELLDEFSKVFGSNVSHLGIWDHAHLELNGTLNTRVASAPLDVFGLTTASGTDIHFSYMGNTTNGIQFKFGWGSGTTETKVKGRTESFDTQYFTSGGIDFIIFENFEDGGKLDAYADYGWIYDQTSCIMAPDMTAAGHFFQIYDNVKHGTMAIGAVAPFSGPNHEGAISSMTNAPLPLATNSKCVG